MGARRRGRLATGQAVLLQLGDGKPFNLLGVRCTAKRTVWDIFHSVGRGVENAMMPGAFFLVVFGVCIGGFLLLGKIVGIGAFN